MKNAFVLSEKLEENAVKTLVNIVIEDIFPKPCDKWRNANQEIRTRYKQELAKREDMARQKIARGEDSLWRALHDAVVEDVIMLFPYDCFRRSLDSVLLMRSLNVGHWNVTACPRMREPVMT
jgi:hypothetical protein